MEYYENEKSGSKTERCPTTELSNITLKLT